MVFIHFPLLYTEDYLCLTVDKITVNRIGTRNPSPSYSKAVSCVPLLPTKYRIFTSLTVQATLTVSGHCIVGIKKLNSILYKDCYSFGWKFMFVHVVYSVEFVYL